MKLIHRPSGDPDRTQRLGSYILESLIDADEEGAGTAYRVRIAPHERTAVSYHRVAEEYYYVLSGRGVVILEGHEYPLAPGLPALAARHYAWFCDRRRAAGDARHSHAGSRPDRDVYFVDGAPPEGFSELKE